MVDLVGKRRSNLTRALAAVLALQAASTAWAQSEAGGSDIREAEASANNIVVTANKRSERLQDVPTSVAIVGGDQLAQQSITAVPDLVRATPALNASGSFGALSIRRSEEHTSELQSLMRISYAVFCLKQKNKTTQTTTTCSTTTIITS